VQLNHVNIFLIEDKKAPLQKKYDPKKLPILLPTLKEE